MISAVLIREPGTYNDEFNRLNALIEEAAIATPGYLGVESWTSDDGKRHNATCYWENLECLKALTPHGARRRWLSARRVKSNLFCDPE